TLGAAAGNTALSPDEKTIAVGEGCAVRLWDLDTGRELLTHLAGHGNPVSGMAFAPDGRSLTSIDNNDVRVWDRASGKLQHQLMAFGNCLGFSPDGCRLLTFTDRFGSDLFPRVWDLRAGEELLRLTHEQENRDNRWEMRAAAYTPDGKSLLS